MIKKLFMLMLAVVILISAVAGCTTVGTGTSTSDRGTEVNDPINQGIKENFNKVGYPIVNDTITVTSMFAPASIEGNPEEMSYWRKLEEITNIHIEWRMLPSSEPNAIQLYFAAGDFPDFFHAYVDTERQFTYGVEGGQFVDYSELLYEYMPNLVSWFKEYPQAENAIRQINGAVYTLPRIQAHATYSIGQMFFRTDYLDKLDLKTPSTIDEFYNTLAVIKNAGLTEGYTPLLPYGSGGLNNHTEAFLFSAFGEATDFDFADDGIGKVVFNRTSEQYRRYIEFMNKLYKENLLENEIFTIDTATCSSRIKAGQAAFMSNAAMLMEEDFEDGKIHLDCLAPLTSEYTSTKKVKAYPSVSSIGGAINKNSKYVKELLRMFDINYSKDEVISGSGFNCLSQNLGLEGVDWEWINEEKSGYRFIIPEDWSENVWNYISKYVSWNGYTNAFVTFATTGSGNTYAREIGMLKNNIPYAVPQFPDALMKYTVEEKNSITNKLTDIQNYVTQARAQFITGVEPISNWDKYVAEIEAMGINDVLTVKQAAYDRWNGK